MISISYAGPLTDGIQKVRPHLNFSLLRGYLTATCRVCEKQLARYSHEKGLLNLCIIHKGILVPNNGLYTPCIREY